ncbi:MAG: hypothetical protein QME07_03265 [bacterium]|nr:hypothetical protein [bacterium]
MKKHLDKEFTLLSAKVGGAEGKFWWFKDTSVVPRLNEIPPKDKNISENQEQLSLI